MSGPRDPLPGGPIDRTRFGWPEELQIDPEPPAHPVRLGFVAAALIAATIIVMWIL